MKERIQIWNLQQMFFIEWWHKTHVATFHEGKKPYKCSGPKSSKEKFPPKNPIVFREFDTTAKSSTFKNCDIELETSEVQNKGKLVTVGKDIQMNMEDNMSEGKEEMFDSKEPPNENTIFEEFVERNLNLFVDKVIYMDGEGSKDFQVESEKDLIGMEEEILDSKDDPLSILTNKDMDHHIPSVSQEVPEKQQRKQQLLNQIKSILREKEKKSRRTWGWKRGSL